MCIYNNQHIMLFHLKKDKNRNSKKNLLCMKMS